MFCCGYENRAELHQMRLAHSESASVAWNLLDNGKVFVDKFLELREKQRERKNLRSWIKHPRRSCWNEQTVEKETLNILNPSSCRQRWCLSYFSLLHLLAFVFIELPHKSQQNKTKAFHFHRNKLFLRTYETRWSIRSALIMQAAGKSSTTENEMAWDKFAMLSR